MKRAIPLALLAASVGLVIVVNAAAGPDHHGGRTISVVEHATTDAVTNGTTGDDAGNILTLRTTSTIAPTRRRSAPIKGPVFASCRESWECSWTTFLRKGQSRSRDSSTS